jgi:hypothetical protein
MGSLEGRVNVGTSFSYGTNVYRTVLLMDQ